jgi:hypothetical protein
VRAVGTVGTVGGGPGVGGVGAGVGVGAGMEESMSCAGVGTT